MIITAEQAKLILWEDSEEFNLVSDDGWKQDGKYQLKTVIFEKEICDDHFYSLTVSRSGSPFTDWYYEW